MAIGLAAGYGMFGYIIGRFLLPNGSSLKQLQFLGTLEEVRIGQSMTYLSPAGERVVVTRISDGGEAGDFIALSSVCPHLGCQVHWETQRDRFFCPCHNGAFDSQGNPLSGPPKDARQTLPRYELVVEDGLLFIDIRTESLVSNRSSHEHRS